MEIVNLLEAKSRMELREWLIRNYRTETECWVVVKRGRPKDDGTFWYIDAVEEALCFGWIDSMTKRMDDGRTIQKLCPRRAKKQLVGTKQGKVPKNGTARINDRCRKSRTTGYVRQRFSD